MIQIGDEIEDKISKTNHIYFARINMINKNLRIREKKLIN